MLRNYFEPRRRQYRGQTQFKATERVEQFYEYLLFHYIENKKNPNIIHKNGKMQSFH